MNRNALVVADNAGHLYRRMSNAIARCHSIDDCKEIADQASAIAAYYKQIKDDESVRKFLEVKIRAWRRLAEIFSTVSEDGCGSVTVYINKIRAAFPDCPVNDSQIRNALKLGKVPSDFFEQNVEENNSVEAMIRSYSTMLDIQWRESPEGKEQRRIWRRQAQEQERRYAKEEKARAAAKELDDEDIQRLKIKRDEAFAEVGITLDRRDRENMHQVVFLIKKQIHEVLRQAAFDNRTTMQAILRSGLAMWFIANGYDVAMKDMDLPKMERR
jgi:hypothetical protein